MPLFRKKKPQPSNEEDLREIEASVRNIRSRMSEHKMPLGDLFALMNEDERPILAQLPRKDGSELERVLPHQVVGPNKKAAPDAPSTERSFRSL